ncbi:MAG: sugar ABC transporter permease, partial [Actinobacteria bacterium]|nr:sugar ABC transporter permease [Actinomycetota bacterium]
MAGPEESGPATSARAHKRETSWRKRTELTVLLVPPLVLFIGFVLVPIVFAAWYSLYNWSGYGPLTDFVG